MAIALQNITFLAAVQELPKDACKRRVASCQLLRQLDFKNPQPNPLLDPGLRAPVSFAAHHWKHYGWGTLGVDNQRW